MNHKSTERGQALILIALAAIGLFAFAALAIDGSRSFSNKRHAQNAADTAALTAALTEIRAPGDATAKFTAAEIAAVARVKSNGYKNDSATIVDVDQCDNVIDIINGQPVPGDVKVDAAGVPILDASGNLQPLPCEGIVTGKESEYVRVKIISEIPTTFGRVLGRETLLSAVEAVARVQGSSSKSSLPEDAVVALDDSNKDPVIWGGGNVKFEVHNSGVFSNGTSVDCNNKKSSITLWTNFQPYAEKGFTTPSADSDSFCLKGITLAPGSEGFHAGKKLDPKYDIPIPAIPCGGPANPTSDTPAGKVVHPGWHYGNFPVSSGTWTFEPGNHCFDSGLNLNANVMTADNVNILVQAGGFKINTNGTFTCDSLVVFAEGGVEIGGGGDLTCDRPGGVTFYVNSGVYKSTGNPTMTLKAPTSGDYQGLLVYLPAGNTSAVHVGGTADIQLTGSIIAPGSPVTLIGTSNSNGLDTQVVGKTIKLDGTADVIINYNPDTKYKPPAKPTISSTK